MIVFFGRCGLSAILSWVIGGVALGLVALGFIEMTRVRSISGGLVRYPQETNGSLVAAIIGWAIWLAYSANPPTEASGIIQYLSKLMPGLYDGTPLTASGILVAILIMIVFVVINYFGVNIFAKVNAEESRRNNDKTHVANNDNQKATIKKVKPQNR